MTQTAAENQTCPVIFRHVTLPDGTVFTFAEFIYEVLPETFNTAHVQAGLGSALHKDFY